ncbi:MAG: tRNA glutamyl-Q(34) synthetase GluQRS, partial [Pseudohongiellaceae bacterium]
MAETTDSGRYVGRFAPSPTGPLHMGSLIAALASFLDARANQGSWLVRMEDLDPPREVQGAAAQILDQLQQFGMQWDGEVLYQSQRHGAYSRALSRLEARGLVYRCDCSRARIRALGSVYDGHCRERSLPPTAHFALRLRTDMTPVTFSDAIQGDRRQVVEREVGDFVIRRKDGLFAYQLAVVVDDAYQNISHVLRGYDLLESTARQIYLQRCLQLPMPGYAHIPIIVNADGEKLSKQHFARPVNAAMAPQLLHEALKFLGLRPPADQRQAKVATQLEWAIGHWDIQSVPKLATIPELS